MGEVTLRVLEGREPHFSRFLKDLQVSLPAYTIWEIPLFMVQKLTGFGAEITIKGEVKSMEQARFGCTFVVQRPPSTFPIWMLPC